MTRPVEREGCSHAVRHCLIQVFKTLHQKSSFFLGGCCGWILIASPHFSHAYVVQFDTQGLSCGFLRSLSITLWKQNLAPDHTEKNHGCWILIVATDLYLAWCWFPKGGIQTSFTKIPFSATKICPLFALFLCQSYQFPKYKKTRFCSSSFVFWPFLWCRWLFDHIRWQSDPMDFNWVSLWLTGKKYSSKPQVDTCNSSRIT